VDSQNLTSIYVIYFAASIGLTSWLAVVLNRNGRTFLHDVFEDQPELGAAVNRLLTIGFFMFNLGYAFLILRAQPTTTTEETVNFLANRLGLLLVSLAVLHFVNLAVFARIRRPARRAAEPPQPAAPAAPPAPRMPPPPVAATATFVPVPPAPAPAAGPWAQPGVR
jgi:hypothetical protein